MGWGKTRRITGLTWSFGDALNAAASLGQAQLPAAALPAWIAGSGGDDYGAGSGTWEPDDAGRDGVLVRLPGDCGDDTHWSVGGTEGEPELWGRTVDPQAGGRRLSLTGPGTPGSCAPRRP
jgi:hypothetical protein